MFVNADKENCGVTKCSLLQEDNKTPLTDKNVVMDAKEPWGFKFANNVVKGYSLKFNYVCTNDKQTLSKLFDIT